MKKINKTTRNALIGASLVAALASCSPKEDDPRYIDIFTTENAKILYVRLEDQSSGTPGLEIKYFDVDGDMKTVERYTFSKNFGLRGIFGDRITDLPREDMGEAQRDSIDAEYQRLIEHIRKPGINYWDWNWP